MSLCYVIALFLAAHLDAQLIAPDAATGIIDGKAAAMASPAADEKSLPPQRCNAFYAPAASPEKPFVVPCGSWRVVPSDQYLIWVEQDATISRAPLLRAIDTTAKSGLITLHAMTGAGFVSTSTPSSDDTRVRYIHLSASSRAFTRVVFGSASNKATAMPAGRVAGGVFENRSGRAVTLFHSVDIAAGRSTILIPRAPAVGTSDVFAELIAPADKRLPIDEVDLALGARMLPADDFVDAGDRIYAIWYAVRGDSARVVIPRGNLWYYGGDIALIPGRVTTVRGNLRSKPSLDVVAHVRGDKAPEMFIDVQRPAENKPLNHVAIRNDENTRIESLEPNSYDVFLHISRWKLRKSVDLRNGHDATVDFDVTPIEIHGTVRHGRDPTSAKISFQDYDGWIDVDTDDDGAYRTTLWTPRDYLTRVSLRSDSTNFVELKSIYETGTYDFDLPRTRYVVRVRSAADRRLLQGADVTFENVWKSDRWGEQNVFLNATTNEAGEALLPPLRPGTVSVRAEAKGFERSEFRREPVEENGDRVIDIALQPITDSARLKLTLPNGAPADGAELLAMPRTGDQVLWRGTAGAGGVVDVPRFSGDVVLMVRHRNAASAVRAWNNSDDEWRLTEADPLVAVKVERTGTTNHLVQIAAWIDDLRVSGIRLAFLSWSAPVADPSGLWVARNLPRAPLRILAWTNADPNAIASGAYDAMAISSNYPHPQPLMLRTID